MLVHCLEGRSRASSLVLAYLIDSEGFYLHDAMRRLKVILSKELWLHASNAIWVITREAIRTQAMSIACVYDVL